VGKTTTLKHLAEDTRSYVTLDDPMALELAQRDPALFLERYQPPVLIDEIQYAPNLLSLIKAQVDRENKAGRFWLTGSQTFHWMKDVSESLAGRVAVLHLLGLSQSEMAGRGLSSRPFLPGGELPETFRGETDFLPLGDLYRQIWRGSFPRLALDPGMDRDLFFSSYVETYLKRDVRDLAQVGDTRAFVRFLRASAARTGQLLNIADLARDADVAPNTAKSWLSILEASGIVFLLEPFSASVTKRLVKAPKLYFLDTGLCSYLTAWSSPDTLEAGAMSGAILETWVIGEILKSYRHSGRTPNLFFYRDKDGKEIDLLIHEDGVLYPVEIKKTASPSPTDIRHFGTLERLGPAVGPGALICLAREPFPLGNGNIALPVRAL
jgi:predicted AAA+ superfamily ATPase